jgi:hypothetical protein
MSLPKEGTPEWETLKSEYPTASQDRLSELYKIYNYKDIDSFRCQMRKHGVSRAKVKHEYPEEPERNPVVELPPVKFHKYINPTPRRKGDEEIAILHISDGHAGKLTNSFNDDVYNSRIEQIFHKTMKIIGLHRNMYPINKLVVLDTGDNIQGENLYQGSKIGDVSMGARDQVKKLATPALNNLIGSLKENFWEVEFHGVSGNHGKDRLAPETSSYDLLLYDILEAGIGKYKGININTHEKWYAKLEINEHDCFMFHGDGIPCQQGVPFFAIDRRLKSWHMQFGGFRYAFGGHFHKAHYDEISSNLEYFMCSTLVSDDDWAQKKLGISSEPSQNIYGIHPKQGITWNYRLNLK